MNNYQIHEKKWKDHWESMISYIKDYLKDCLFVQEEHSVGIIRNRRCFKIFGAEQSFKFEDNTKIFIKAENKLTGRLVRVYEFNLLTKKMKRCSQAHIIHNQYNANEIEFLQILKDAVKNYYRPNSIKFITDAF